MNKSYPIPFFTKPASVKLLCSHKAFHLSRPVGQRREEAIFCSDKEGYHWKKREWHLNSLKNGNHSLYSPEGIDRCSYPTTLPNNSSKSLTIAIEGIDEEGPRKIKKLRKEKDPIECPSAISAISWSISAFYQLQELTLLLFHPSPVQALRYRPRLGRISPTKVIISGVKHVARLSFFKRFCKLRR